MTIYIEDKENFGGQDISRLTRHILEFWDAKPAFEFCDTLGCEVTISQVTPEGLERKCKDRFDNIHLANFIDVEQEES